ncbi:class I SAM-dependent methyltransferase [Variovorax sp. OV329]|uniref:class I SAM-dependent methyltransferase n=1 Tax=Variovorax sp. OV329 TaxID=1882825 RepID=UPI0008E28280|nr:class I SAM-dependent methyltransferase [Variovorax sp. OV329]SFM87695.1 Methyltransferase domain-containing protein [Variovorax sp. OV329]
MAQESLLASIGGYYSEKVREHGATPLGVDWSCVPTQEMRFVQLLKLCDFSEDFSLNDVGCGYGALLQFLKRRYRRRQIQYFGTDLSDGMIAAASRKWRSHPSARFSLASQGLQISDYSVASGIFNVKLNGANEAWDAIIRNSLQRMRDASRKGFAVNFLSAPLNPESGIAELYFAEPEHWAGYCERQLNTEVEIVRGYGLKEFTLLMRHPG